MQVRQCAAPAYAGMAELVDATDSKSVTGDSVWVRVPFPALTKPCADKQKATQRELSLSSHLSGFLFICILRMLAAVAQPRHEKDILNSSSDSKPLRR